MQHPYLALFDRWHEMWRNKDASLIRELITDDLRLEGVSPRPLVGPKDFHDHFFVPFCAAFARIDLHVEHSIILDGEIAVRGTANLTTHEGQTITLQGSAFHEIRDGKFASANAVWDWLPLLAQVGAIAPDLMQNTIGRLAAQADPGPGPDCD